MNFYVQPSSDTSSDQVVHSLRCVCRNNQKDIGSKSGVHPLEIEAFLDRK